MTDFEWDTNYIGFGRFYYVNTNGDRILFYAIHDHQRKVGAYAMEKANGEVANGYYQTRVETGIFYLTLDDKEYLFKATAVGFNLVSCETIHYCFTRSLKSG